MALAAGAEGLESAAVLSAYANYARAVSDECMRNRAYGIATKDLKLAVFCERLGNEAAAKQHQKVGESLNSSAQPGTTNPR